MPQRRTEALMRSLPLMAAVALALPAAAHADERVCRGAIGAETVDNLLVPDGAACSLNATRVNGTIKVATGATLHATEVAVAGNVQAENHADVVVRSSTVGGSVQVKQGGHASIFSNTIGGNLQCKENSPVPVGGGNLVHGSAEDQCARFAGGAGAAGVGPGTGEASGPRGVSPMSPFPVVRIAGRATRRGARIRLLTVRAQPGASVTVGCRGRGCPFGRLGKTVSTRVRGGRLPAARIVRIRRLKGSLLRPGVILRVFVTSSGAIGKYTRFRIRALRIPLRTDLCVLPESLRPLRCPT